MAFLLKWGRMVALGFFFAVVSIVSCVLFLFRFRHPSNSRLFMRILNPFVLPLLGLKILKRNENLLTQNQPCVYVINHQAGLDILTVGEVYPPRTVVIAKRSLQSIPVFGWCFYLAGNLLIKRTNKSHSMGKMEEANEAIKDKGVSIMFFPEGTRSHGSGLGVFKRGAFHCAIENQVPIQPLVVSTYKNRVSFSRWRAGTVVVQALPPLSTNGLNASHVDDLIAKTHEQMRIAIETLDGELARDLTV
jgi:1-acyl-sn-glycerol-3-phosphate acyltransferase